MKKWLGEASGLCGHYSSSTADEDHNSSCLDDEEAYPRSNTRGLCPLGLKQDANPLTSHSSCDLRANASHDCDEFPKHSTVSVITSPHQEHQLASLVQSVNSPTISVQVHASPSPTCQLHYIDTTQSASGSKTNSNDVCSSKNETPLNSVPSCFSDSPLLQDFVSATCKALNYCQNETHQTSSVCGEGNTSENLPSEATPDCEAHSKGAALADALEDCNRHKRNHSTSECDDHLNLTDSSQCVNALPDHYGAVASTSSGCSHWCSTCHVKVKVEVECVPTASNSTRSPSENRQGVRSLSFPKRVRHKIKAPTKDHTGTHKKKKSPWPFKLNSRMRSSKVLDSESDSSSHKMGCTSCVCPRYRSSDNDPIYKSVNETKNSNSINVPLVNLSRYNSTTFPINGEFEENGRQERSQEHGESLDTHPGLGFIPFNQNSLSLPLSYNSMLDLQVLLESSLRLGLGGTRPGGISFSGEQFGGTYSSESSALSRTVHTQVDYIHCLVPDLLAITNCGFYWGKMDRYEAEKLLKNKSEGTFLLRDSAQEEYLFSVSFRRYDRSLHARIEQWNHKFSFDSHDPGVFASETVCGLIEHYKDPSCCMFFEPLLTNPLARTFPFPLQHLCRATVCSQTTYDGISKLDLPKCLKNYLKEYHYKQRVRVRHLD